MNLLSQLKFFKKFQTFGSKYFALLQKVIPDDSRYSRNHVEENFLDLFSCDEMLGHAVMHIIIINYNVFRSTSWDANGTHVSNLNFLDQRLTNILVVLGVHNKSPHDTLYLPKHHNLYTSLPLSFSKRTRIPTHKYKPISTDKLHRKETSYFYIYITMP